MKEVFGTTFEFTFVICLALFLTPTLLHAAPKADLWPRWQKHNPSSRQKIDHDYDWRLNGAEATP